MFLIKTNMIQAIVKQDYENNLFSDNLPVPGSPDHTAVRGTGFPGGTQTKNGMNRDRGTVSWKTLFFSGTAVACGLVSICNGVVFAG